MSKYHKPVDVEHLMEDDAASSPMAAYTPDPSVCPECGRSIDGDLNEEEKRKAWQEISVTILSFVASRRNPLVALRALPFAFGCPMTGGISQDTAARSLGFTKARFNKEVRLIQKSLLARQNRNNNPQDKESNGHWRNQTSKEAARTAIRRSPESHAH